MEVTVQSFSAAWLSFMSPERFQSLRVLRTNCERSYQGGRGKGDTTRIRGRLLVGSTLSRSVQPTVQITVSVHVSASRSSSGTRSLHLMPWPWPWDAPCNRNTRCVCVCVLPHLFHHPLLPSRPTVLACRASAVGGEGNSRTDADAASPSPSPGRSRLLSVS